MINRLRFSGRAIHIFQCRINGVIMSLSTIPTLSGVNTLGPGYLEVRGTGGNAGNI